MTIANMQDVETVIPVAGRQMRNAILASVLGWSLDLFDLFILLYVAPVVGALFFPSSVPTLSLAAVYASFAVTLLMRPIGSAIFGHYADVHGRKGAMVVAIVGVGISTAVFGVLPTIAQAGPIAPVLFLVLRLVQGVFVGGVVASTHTIGTESVSLAWRGAMSGLVGGGGAGIGALLASFIFLITSSIFPGDAFAVWGWRVRFFFRAFELIARVVHFQKPGGISILQGTTEEKGRRQDHRNATAGESVVLQQLSQCPFAQPAHDLRRRRGLLSDFRLSAILSQGGERRAQ